MNGQNGQWTKSEQELSQCRNTPSFGSSCIFPLNRLFVINHIQIVGILPRQ